MKKLKKTFIKDSKNRLKWKFAVDTGGTFTDIIGVDPDLNFHTMKILSDSPEYEDACIEGIRRMLGINQDVLLPEDRIEAIRFGTTVATNALLERKGGRVALLTTEGFSDLLEIGYQNRPYIFSLCIKKPSHLYSSVFEVEERIDSKGKIVKRLDRQKLIRTVKKLTEEKTDSVSVVLMHSWKNPEHELLCEKILLENGIQNILLSHKTMNSIKIIGRGHSTVLDAYLSPVLAQYLEKITKWTGKIRIEFIQSSGRLATSDSFRGKNSLYSGPAGGVIATGHISDDMGIKGAIGFDMGGTSTDVSRYDGEFERMYEHTIEGIEFQTEMLNIITVASGGGSTLWFDGQKMRVGPESAGAYPGPSCYGFGGPLTITDANLLTGRIAYEYFPKTFGSDRKSPLDIHVVRRKFKDLTEEIRKNTNCDLTAKDLALGFLRISNERMAMAIKEISVSKGFDVRDYALVCFGGAGGQHACEVASILGINKIIFHTLSSLMSAYGIGLAKKSYKSSRTVLKPYVRKTHKELSEVFFVMEKELLPYRQTGDTSFYIQREVDLRPAGTDAFLTVPYGKYDDVLKLFRIRYQRLFGFYPEHVTLELVNARVEIQDKESFFTKYSDVSTDIERDLKPASYQKLYYTSGPVNVPVYLRSLLPYRKKIKGPAFIVDENSTLIVDAGFKGEVFENGMIVMEMATQSSHKHKTIKQKDPVLLEVFNNLFMGISTQMGNTLKNTAYSINIKERLDFSCAVFDSQGNLVANAPHIPVHLGSMVDTVKGIIEDHRGAIKPGDIFLSNNPYKGGSHLPDITVICPVFSYAGEIIFFTASRGHHADIGGTTPGSIPPYVEHIDEEGILIDSFLLVREGMIREKEIRRIFTQHKYPVRNINERILDLKAQIASCQRGVKELKEVIKRYGLDTVKNYMNFIQENASFSVKQALYQFLEGKNIFMSAFEDYLDDGSSIKVKITITGETGNPETVKAVIDFAGTCPQHLKDNLNTPLSVTRSAVLYVLRSITGTDIPLNSGCLEPINIIVPEGSILNPAYPAPVASGNVETSQRIVDVLLGALKVAAASQGTMNNLLFEIEGGYPYYETIAGGSGATDGCAGASGVQIHMTNTKITDPEILELRYHDVMLERFTLRRGSGGKGLYPGGDGVIRELKFLKPATVTIISERRNYEPYGMNGGENGEKGVNLLKKSEGKIIKLPHRIELKVEPGDSIIIETPGGGGFGFPFKAHYPE
ncbi:MAG: hypothetical protein A2Y97_06085 [Nitrospirae bacterium RBG_13_39_12]|nr:MAG: hypothetical protein A2Y97_06085 [Nitrospirae bacterium RBG_13_39_12]